MAYYKHYFDSEEIEGSADRILAKNELVYELIAPHLAPRAAVLELGVGKGWFAQVSTGHGHAYRGVEVDEDQCGVLTGRGFDITCGQVPPVPLAEGDFGLIYSAHLIEHLPGGHAVHELLADCPRLLAEDGVVALLFPDAMALGSHFWDCDYTHDWPTTERRVANVLADAGFEVIASHKISGHFRGARKLAARAGSRPTVLRLAQALARSPGKRDLYYRGWLYLQQNILLIARRQPGHGSAS